MTKPRDYGKLRRFNESNKCPKCGAGEATIRYNEKLDVIHRKCPRCRHGWIERPNDYKVKK